MSEPMDNNKQAVDIKGYRVLDEIDKAYMNLLKKHEQDILEELERMRESVANLNQRSLAIAKTEIQTGFMWAIRAIARPNGE